MSNWKRNFSAVLVACFWAGAFSAQAKEGISPEVMKLHQEAIVVDLHADTQFMIVYMGYDISKRHRTVDWGLAGVLPIFSDIDIPRLREGGVDLFTMAICPLPENNQTPGAEAFARRSLARIEQVVKENSEDLEIALSPEHTRKIITDGKIAVLLGLEGGQGIENNLDTLREFYQRGMRYMTLTHFKHLDWATSATDKSDPGFKGLTDFGRQVVKEMERMGMMIDLAHVSPETFWDTLETTHCPVIDTHAGARALADHPRNLTDEQIKAIAERGGVVGVIFHCGFLDPTGKKPCDINLVAEHIDYIKKLAGIDVLALGSDWDGGVIVPKELADASKIPNLTAELKQRGYTDEEVRKILGENFLKAWQRIIDCAE